MADTLITTEDFHGAKLIARRGDTPTETLVAMKPVVEGMGLDWKGLYDKIKGHPVLNTCMGVIPMQVPATTAAKICTFVAKATATASRGE